MSYIQGVQYDNCLKKQQTETEKMILHLSLVKVSLAPTICTFTYIVLSVQYCAVITQRLSPHSSSKNPVGVLKNH